MYTIRVKPPSGVKLMPHRHPEDRVYTVISGVFYIGRGEQFDAEKLHAYPPGAVIVLPGDTPHFHWARSGEYVTQVSAHRAHSAWNTWTPPMTPGTPEPAMIITGIESVPLRIPFRPGRSSAVSARGPADLPAVDSLLVKVTTEQGHEGWGEALRISRRSR